MKDKQWKWSAQYNKTNKRNCVDKRVFNSSAEAHSFNKRAPRFLGGSKRREHLHVYRCNYCRQWHIGHEPTRKPMEDHRG